MNRLPLLASPQQLAVLAYLRAHIAEHGYAPTNLEGAAHFGWASGTAFRDHLIALWRKGYIAGVAKGRGQHGKHMRAIALRRLIWIAEAPGSEVRRSDVVAWLPAQFHLMRSNTRGISGRRGGTRRAEAKRRDGRAGERGSGHVHGGHGARTRRREHHD